VLDDSLGADNCGYVVIVEGERDGDKLLALGDPTYSLSPRNATSMMYTKGASLGLGNQIPFPGRIRMILGN
jgi:hypothetical protein